MVKKKVRQTKKENDKKKRIFIVVSIVIILGIIISTIYNSTNIRNKKGGSGVETMKLQEFIDLDLNEVINKIKNVESFVLYVGYTGCQACESYSPVLKRVQTQRDSETYYLDYKSINKKSKDWKTLTSAINVEQKLTVSKDGEKVTIDDKIGNIMKKNGYTPVTVLFKNGKCVNAHIGSMSSNDLEKFLND